MCTGSAHFRLRGGFSPFFPAPFGIPSLESLVRFWLALFLSTLSKELVKFRAKKAAATEWLHMQIPAQLGQVLSQQNKPLLVWVITRGLGLDLLATTIVLCS